MTVTSLDPYGNTDTTYVGPVHFTSTSLGVLPGDYTFAGANAAVGVFSVTLNNTGNQTVTVTDTVTSSITGTSNNVAVQSASTRFTISAPASVFTGDAFSITVRAVDRSGNLVSNYNGTVQFMSSDLAAVLPANSALHNGVGTFTVILNTLGNQSVIATDVSNSALNGSGAVSVAAMTAVVTANGPSGYEGAGLNNVEVATFTYGDDSLPAGSFATTIKWGDGSTSTGTVVAIADGYQVNGSHVYKSVGNFAMNITTSTGGVVVGQVNETATIYAPLLPDGTRGTATQRLISGLYYDLLGRDVDAGAVAYWNSALSSGMTVSQFVQTLERSTEFLANEAQATFNRYLHRDADRGSLPWVVQLLRNGATVEQLSYMLLSSSEYYLVRSGGNNAAFLQNVFQDVLGRAIDPSALGWFEQLMATSMTPSQVVNLLLSGAEYRADLIEADFQRLLGRQADPAAIAGFSQLMSNGLRDEQVLVFIVGQPAGGEYYNRVTS